MAKEASRGEGNVNQEVIKSIEGAGIVEHCRDA